MKPNPLLSYRPFWISAAALLLAFTISHAEIDTPKKSAAYSVQVSGHGAPVFFIPGLGCSGEVWAHVVKNLEATHECHVFTLAGFGGQPPVAGEFLPAMEAALGEYLQAHGTLRPVVVGHSLGGLLALKLSAQFPAAVAGAVIVDSLPFFSGTQAGATPEAARQYASGLHAALEKQPHDAFLAGIRQGLPGLVTTASNQEIVFSWMQQSDQGTVARAMSEVIATDARAEIAHITCPLMLIEAGAGPGAVPAELFTQQYSSARLLTRVRVSDAQHFVMLDQPARFLGDLTTFLGSLR